MAGDHLGRPRASGLIGSHTDQLFDRARERTPVPNLIDDLDDHDLSGGILDRQFFVYDFASGSFIPVYGPPVVSTQFAGTAYTFVLLDAQTVKESTGAAAAAATIPPVASVPWPVGTVIEVFQYGAGQVTIVAGAGVTLRSDGARVKTGGQYATVGLRHRATNEWVLSGDLN